jgi:WbqC-like protein family
VTIHQPEHLPWLGFFAKAASADQLILLNTVPYRHGYFQNRNRLSHDGKPTWLTVPVRHRGHLSKPIREIEIDERGRRWRRQYLGRLEDALRNAAHAEDVLMPLTRIIEQASGELCDLNLRIIGLLSELLDVQTPAKLASELDVGGSSTDLLVGLCERTGADVYLSGPSGRDYLDLEHFRRRAIAVEYFRFAHPNYPRGREPWMEGLSSVDLIAHVGIERARDVLRHAVDASELERAPD